MWGGVLHRVWLWMLSEEELNRIEISRQSGSCAFQAVGMNTAIVAGTAAGWDSDFRSCCEECTEVFGSRQRVCRLCMALRLAAFP